MELQCVPVDVDVDVERHEVVSMMIICNDIVIIEHDGRRSGLPSAPVVIEHDNNSTDESTAIALNIQYNPYIFTYSHT